jgi:hypothetical protein
MYSFGGPILVLDAESLTKSTPIEPAEFGQRPLYNPRRLNPEPITEA